MSMASPFVLDLSGMITKPIEIDAPDVFAFLEPQEQRDTKPRIYRLWRGFGWLGQMLNSNIRNQWALLSNKVDSQTRIFSPWYIHTPRVVITVLFFKINCLAHKLEAVPSITFTDTLTKKRGNKGENMSNTSHQKVKDLGLSGLEEEILSLLDVHTLYGVEIVDAIEDATQGERKLGFGSLYPTLRRLENRGLITGKWGEETPDERAGARRKYYSATEKGTEALSDVRERRQRIIAWQPASTVTS